MHRCSFVQLFKHARVKIRMYTGIQACRHIGEISELYRHTGVQMQRLGGVQELRYSYTQTCRCAGLHMSMCMGTQVLMYATL